MAPPDPIPNSEVKHVSGDGSVGFPHVRVAHRQTPNSKKHQSPLSRVGFVVSTARKLAAGYPRSQPFPKGAFHGLAELDRSSFSVCHWASLVRYAHHSSPPCESSTAAMSRCEAVLILRERAIRLDGPFFVCAVSKTLPELIKGSDSPFPQKALACYSLMAKPNPSCIINRLVLHRHRRINPSMVHRPARHPCLALFTLGVPLAPLVRYTHRSSPPCERSITHTVVRHVSM